MAHRGPSEVERAATVEVQSSLEGGGAAATWSMRESPATARARIVEERAAEVTAEAT